MKKINLALQGGGAHGAFTWGVLDRILEEDDVEIAAISGASAGSLNGAALKAGLAVGGREGARENLDWLWTKIGGVHDLRMPTWMSAWMPGLSATSQALEYSMPYVIGETISRSVSPYSWGPFYRNPLENVVKQLQFDKVCSQEGPELFVGATCVRDGKIRIFNGETLSTQAILASACLPTLFQAVECTDPETGVTEAFWDGGYTGNPALFPLFAPELPEDIVIVNINPLVREEIPSSPMEIQNRINEISFNSSLLRELRAIEFVQRLLAEGTMTSKVMKDVKIHMIADDDLMNDLSVATKTVPLPTVIAELKAAGRRAAGTFLADHKQDINVRQSADLRGMFG